MKHVYSKGIIYDSHLTIVKIIFIVQATDLMPSCLFLRCKKFYNFGFLLTKQNWNSNLTSFCRQKPDLIVPSSYSIDYFTTVNYSRSKLSLWGSLKSWNNTVIQQNWNHPKYYLLWLTLYLFYWFEILGVFSNHHLSTHAVSDSFLCSVSHSLNLLLSFYLFLSSAYSPLCFYLPPFYIKGHWFPWSASLNKCI